MERLAILDGHGYIFRAHFALATAGKERQGVRLSTSGGMPTGALYVYAAMLVRLHLDERPARIAVVFDAPGPTFRDELDAAYKAHRTEMPDDLKVQMPYFRPLTEAFAWPVLSVAGVEADDVIATLVDRARARAWDATIFSGDKDLMQLVDDHVVMVDSMRQIRYDAARVTEKFGVPPALVGDYLALVGDSSDNVPGVAGVGKVTAAKLLTQFGSIEGLLAHAGELKGKLKETLADPVQLSRLALSRKLVALKRDCELPCELDELVARPWDGARLRAMLEELEFGALAERLEGKTRAAAASATASVAASAPAGRSAEREPTAKGDSPGSRPASVAASASASASVAASDSVAASASVAASDSATSRWQIDAAPELILTVAALEAVVAAARAAGAVALHAETDGVRAERARLIGLALAVPGRAPAYLPIAHRYLSAPVQLGDAARGPLAALVTDPAVAVTSHDGKELTKALAAFQVPAPTLGHDTMLAAYLLDSSSEGFAVGSTATAALGVTLEPRAALTGAGRAAVPFESVPVEHAARWAARVAAVIGATADTLAPRLERAGQTKLYRELELPLASLLARIERIGVKVDVEHLRRLSDRVGAELAALERTIYQLAGGELNLGSPKQLGALLFERLGLTSERMKKTKTGFSTDHEVLESLVELHPIVAPILEHRELGKLKSTYIDALPPLIDPATGRLHTSFRQAVAATGRLSSVEPNLQNIPIRSELGREIRRAFVAAPGKTLIAIDYSQIELRVMAHLSKDPVLTRAFVDGIDVHTQTAAEVFGIPVGEVGDHERRVAKAVNYGLIYGQSDFGLARALGIPRAEARHYIERYFERFSTVRRFMDDLVTEARQAGAATTILGRRRPIAGLTARDFRVRSAAERIAQNTPMQGSGADIMKLAMLRVDGVLSSLGVDAAILLTVHDELVLEVDRDAAADVAARAADAMSHVVDLAVPLEVSIGMGATWADAG